MTTSWKPYGNIKEMKKEVKAWEMALENCSEERKAEFTFKLVEAQKKLKIAEEIREDNLARRAAKKLFKGARMTLLPAAAPAEFSPEAQALLGEVVGILEQEIAAQTPAEAEESIKTTLEVVQQLADLQGQSVQETAAALVEANIQQGYAPSEPAEAEAWEEVQALAAAEAALDVAFAAFNEQLDAQEEAANSDEQLDIDVASEDNRRDAAYYQQPASLGGTLGENMAYSAYFRYASSVGDTPFTIEHFLLHLRAGDYDLADFFMTPEILVAAGRVK